MLICDLIVNLFKLENAELKEFFNWKSKDEENLSQTGLRNKILESLGERKFLLIPTAYGLTGQDFINFYKKIKTTSFGVAEKPTILEIFIDFYYTVASLAFKPKFAVEKDEFKDLS